VPVFIVEGAIDALSIAEVGGEACALGSTSGVDKFLDMVGRERPTVPLILSLDNDKAGKDAQAKLKTWLEARKISFYEVPNKWCIFSRVKTHLFIYAFKQY